MTDTEEKKMTDTEEKKMTDTEEKKMTDTEENTSAKICPLQTDANSDEKKVAPNFDWSKIPTTSVDSKREEIKVGDYLVIERGDFRKLHKFRKEDDILSLGKMSVKLKPIIGQRYESYFKLVFVERNIYSLSKSGKPKSMIELIKIAEHGQDNRNIVDDGNSQKLSTSEIIELRQGPTSSTDILQKLIRNSTTFASKTEFSQVKYLKKKENKYCEYLKIRKPSIPIIAEIYYRFTDPRAISLRRDDLAQILFYSAVCCYGNHLVYESGTAGLLVASILNRIGVKTEAHLVHVHPGNEPQRQAILAMNFPEELHSRYVNVNLYSVLRWYYQQYKPFLKLRKTTPKHEIKNKAKRAKLDCKKPKIEIKKPEEEKKIEVEISEEFKPENIEILSENLMEEMEVSVNRVIIRQAEKCAKPTESAKEESGPKKPNLSIKNLRKRKRKPQKSAEKSSESCRITRKIETPGLDLSKLKQWQVDNLKACELFDGKMDSLIIVTKEDPFQIYKAFRPFISPNKAVVVYSESVETLSRLYLKLKERGDIINVHITESFMRSWQVLPKRTHPMVKMTNGGYILRGITVSTEINKVF